MFSFTSLAHQFQTGILLADKSADGTDDLGSAIQDLWDYISAGGFFMLAIGLCSLFAVTVILFKALTLRRKNVIDPETHHAINAAVDLDRPGEEKSLRVTLGGDATPLGRIGAAAVAPNVRSREEAVAAAQTGARAEVVKLESGITALEVVITIAPLLGLLGTAAGLVGVFGALGDAGGGLEDTDPRKLAAGIAQALGTTIAGLVVAVPTVIAHSFFTRKIEHFAVEMEGIIGALVGWLYPSVSKESKSQPISRQVPQIDELANAVAASTGATGIQGGAGMAGPMPPQQADPTR